MADETLLASLMIRLGIDVGDFESGLNSAVDAAAQAGAAADNAASTAARGADRAAGKAGEGATEAQKRIASLQQKMREADAQFQSLGNKWAGAIKSLALNIAGPITAAFAVWKGITGYASQVGQVASMTGAHNAQADEYLKKRALLSRVTREDIELYRKSREAVTRFQIAMGDLTAKISRSFSPAVKAGVEILERLTKWVNAHQNDLARFFRIAAAVITAVFLPALARMAAALMMNPLTWIIAAIGSLILIIDDLVTYLHGGTTALGDFWAMLGSREELAETFGTVMEWINGALDVLKGHLPQIILGLGALFSVLGSFVLVHRAVGGVLSTLQGMGAAFGTVAKTAVAFGQIAGPMLLHLRGLFVALLTAARSLFAVIVANPVILAIAAIVAAVGGLVTAFIKGGGTISGMFAVLRGWLENVLNLLGFSGDTVLAVFDAVAAGITRAVDVIASIPGAITEAAQAVYSWLAALPGRFIDVFNSIAEGIKNIFSALWSWISDLLDPSKLMNKAADAARGAFSRVKSWFGFGDDEEAAEPAPQQPNAQPRAIEGQPVTAEAQPPVMGAAPAYRNNEREGAAPPPVNVQPVIENNPPQLDVQPVIENAPPQVNIQPESTEPVVIEAQQPVIESAPTYFDPALSGPEAVQPVKSNGFLQAVDNLPEYTPGAASPTQNIQNSVNNQSVANYDQSRRQTSNTVTQNNNITINTTADPTDIQNGINSSLALQNAKLQRQTLAVENGVRM